MPSTMRCHQGSAHSLCCFASPAEHVILAMILAKFGSQSPSNSFLVACMHSFESVLICLTYSIQINNEIRKHAIPHESFSLCTKLLVVNGCQFACHSYRLVITYCLKKPLMIFVYMRFSFYTLIPIEVASAHVDAFPN